MTSKLIVFAFVILILIIVGLVSCGPQAGFSAQQTRVLLATPELVTPAGNAENDAAVAAMLLTQAQDGVNAEAAATAEMARAQAQAILNAANATLGVAQTQAQGEANIVNAEAQSTLAAAASTQAAAQTEDAIRQTQSADLATSNALALLEQQKQDSFAAETQTAVANIIATQTQSAISTEQAQEREREQQMQGTISFLTLVCLPLFLIVLGGLMLWGFWRWLRIQQANQLLLESPVEVLPAPQPHTMLPSQNVSRYLEDSNADHHPQLTTPENQVDEWMDEVKHELRANEEKEENEENEEKENDNDNANG